MATDYTPPPHFNLILPRLCTLSTPFPRTRAFHSSLSSSFSSYTPNRAFSIPPSFTSIRITLALSVRRVITLINKMEVGMREFCPLFLSLSVADVSHPRCRRRRRHRRCHRRRRRRRAPAGGRASVPAAPRRHPMCGSTAVSCAAP